MTDAAGRRGSEESAEATSGDAGLSVDITTVLDLLTEGELELDGRLLDASNATFTGTVTRRCPDPDPDLVAACVYKPIRGERPLDDFPDGTLAYREVAAFILSDRTGWSVAPPTVLRDGPLGRGMVQLWIDVDETADVLALLRSGHPALRRMALFDVIANNTDRKLGHLLPTPEGHIYGCDHGLCFSVEPKLRTMLWAWRGRRLAPEEIEMVENVHTALRADLGDALRELLAPDEVLQTRRRVEDLLRRPVFPHPDPDRPAIPWPPY
jgi:hypothetical protein